MRFSNPFRFRKKRNGIPSSDEEETEEEGSDSGRERSEVSERNTEVEEEEEECSERKKRWNNESSPPDDDCCSICFGDFTIPCRAPCGHWFCADCILQYWNHGAALQPCKCPMCSQLITRLIPEASFDRCQDIEVLQNVRKYNRFFVGGTYGFILKVLESPFLIKRIFCEMMDPDAANDHFFKLRLFAIFLGGLYSLFHFDFLPTGPKDAVNFFDNFAIGLALILYMIGLYRRWRRSRLVRQLAVAQN
ncbi:hypothetical protein Vadar_011467 [Vaccinium darrowii]|uniref:Uncharacterized protein n=1 Tax=Vaccinium darrowii TaxID=229202 RepID=A0ACB7WZP8_9ERIC|nr:hypothetical protein Vadar_011467 [Vaccinium darrowii]